MAKYPYSQRLAVDLLLRFFKWLAYVPLVILRGISYLIEAGIYQLVKNDLMPAMRKRYAIALINLRLCFPLKDQAEIRQIWRASFRESVLSYLSYGLLFGAGRQRLIQQVNYRGLEHLAKHYPNQSLIVIVPHFCAFDLGLNRTSIDFRFCSSYKRVDSYFFTQLKAARLRFVHADESQIFATDEGFTKIIRAIRTKKLPFFYLPDLDYGETNSLYVPFFAHQQRASLATLPRLAKLSHSLVVSIATYREGNRYIAEFFPALTNYPSGDERADVIKMNQQLEKMILRHPEQYRWYFPLFNTQPGLADGYLYQDAENKLVF